MMTWPRLLRGLSPLLAGAVGLLRLLGLAFALFAAGAGAGWLAGLSLSPVLHTILASIVTAVVATGALLSGLQLHPNEDAPLTLRAGRKLNPVPLALVVVGIAVGASAGVFARTNELLGTQVGRAIARWKSTGYSEQVVARRLFDGLYGESVPPAPSAEPTGKYQEKLQAPSPSPSDIFPEAKTKSSSTDIAKSRDEKSPLPQLFNAPGLNAALDEFCSSLRNATGKDIVTQLRQGLPAEKVDLLLSAATREEAQARVLEKQCKGR